LISPFEMQLHRGDQSRNIVLEARQEIYFRGITIFCAIRGISTTYTDLWNLSFRMESGRP
jgi:hypothetical protein